MNDSEELIGSLDPRRDYGERSYDEVVAEVRAGRLRLEAGRSSLPVIRDPATNRPVKGPGQPRLPDDQELARGGRRRFNERAAADFDAVYDALLEAAKRGDVRAQKLFVETFLGRPREALVANDDRTVELLLALARRTETSTIVLEARPSPASHADPTRGH
jgi:hypothetical protein